MIDSSPACLCFSSFAFCRAKRKEFNSASSCERLVSDKDSKTQGNAHLFDVGVDSCRVAKLKGRGDVLLTGDLAHFQRNYDTDGVPSFNTDRADTLASLDRFKKMAANLKATVVIQHEPADIAKLPAFPQAAE